MNLRGFPQTCIIHVEVGPEQKALSTSEASGNSKLKMLHLWLLSCRSPEALTNLHPKAGAMESRQRWATPGWLGGGGGSKGGLEPGVRLQSLQTRVFSRHWRGDAGIEQRGLHCDSGT